ncbi:MAG TPA: cysteine--1-D-myo-inosityl 2-amino-2-deoxy-alpha-D-glucopyranoside ligase [Mycobacteriales bacterium]|nr:cysteine--1-D-myo-inosityl 2-amino-2-deoxy-alpha-D-glucopyranoside ligase [Mycobacteriales bacterium]
MRSWPTPSVPRLPATPGHPTWPLRLFDTATRAVRPTAPGRTAGMYVCGITPYDATHLGHAATYLAFDLVHRVWLDAGHEVHYVQNVTDVDDPLLERAAQTGQDWGALATWEIELFRADMTALRVLPPRDYVGVVEAVDEVAAAVRQLLDIGAAYRVEEDVYFSVDATSRFGYESGLDGPTMLMLFAERGGDPDRLGKKDPLDPLLWRAARPGEPSWASPVGAGRPGWHVECTAIALNRLGMSFDVQGGGSDLAFPHHEMSAAHAEVLTGQWPFARHYVHAGMVGLDGEKMSKSLGNLVLVSRLRTDGVDPAAIRLALLASHYRSDRDWTPAGLAEAQARLARWRQAAGLPAGPSAGHVLAAVRRELADDLNAPGALAAVDRWVAEAMAYGGRDGAAPGLVRDLADALLGISLS